MNTQKLLPGDFHSENPYCKKNQEIKNSDPVMVGECFDAAIEVIGEAINEYSAAVNDEPIITKNRSILMVKDLDIVRELLKEMKDIFFKKDSENALKVENSGFRSNKLNVNSLIYICYSLCNNTLNNFILESINNFD
ncbi:MAG: hypothetical protein WCJ95_18085 [Mariniphaga sp.]